MDHCSRRIGIVFGHFCGGDKAVMEGNKVIIEGIPFPPLGKTLISVLRYVTL